MKLSDKIWTFAWFLPSFIVGYVTLTSDLCNLNHYTAAFISIWIYFISVSTEINRERLQNQINKLKEEIK